MFKKTQFMHKTIYLDANIAEQLESLLIYIVLL